MLDSSRFRFSFTSRYVIWMIIIDPTFSRLFLTNWEHFYSHFIKRKRNRLYMEISEKKMERELHNFIPNVNIFLGDVDFKGFY